MDKTYNPSLFEEKLYKHWLEKGYFKAAVDNNKTPYTIIMPPPNITSRLHMGHAFQQTIQDIIIRRKRMQGYSALWLPGTDHAAIATEAKVVDKLAKEGKTKESIGRDEFLKEIHKWYDEYKGVIIEQFKRMGFSCDWDRLAFTMDDRNCRAVREVFVRLYKKGYIYRGVRIVNWCPHCKTSISDIEVEFEENKTNLWHLRYQIEGTNDYVTLATTRPETLFGDTAVAVNPKDSRYKDIVGKNVILPIVNRPIPVIADDYVEMDFGTGVVKITPSHDINDFEVGLRHNLPQIRVIESDGKLNKEAGEFEGLDRIEARDKIVAKLKELGNLVKIEPYNNNVGHCERCHSTIEPMLSKQWFVKMEELAKPAIKAVEEDKVHFVEERFKRIYLHWMKNIKDWCISRQLWSGHRIPIFTCDDCGEVIVEREDPTVCPKCGSHHLTQDPDTLDTWFSSALWPLSTLGFPDKTPDFDYFYPTDVLVTAQEILQLWVARMIFSGLEYVGDIPFRNVLINGTVKDIHGRKMSKNLGNGVDPIEMIDKYGVDALRFSVLNGISVDMDSRFSEKKVELTRNFINKIWNASLFVLKQIEGKTVKHIDEVKLSNADKWIIGETNRLIASVNKKFDKFDLGMSASELYDFFWTKFCDWYIEMAKCGMTEEKTEGTVATLTYVLTTLLKLMHPYMPFVTEKIYLELPFHDETIVTSAFPESHKELNYSKERKQMELVLDIIRQIRGVRAEMKVADNVKTKLILLPLEHEKFVLDNAKIIEKLSNCKDIEIIKSESDIKEECTVCINNLLKAYLPSSSLVDKEKELARLTAELNKAESEIARAEGKLNNQGFVSKAPAKLIEEEKQKLENYKNIKQNVLLALDKLK